MKKHSFTVSYFCVSAVNIMHGFSLRDVQALGVNLLGHQRKIVNAAKQLRTHLTQGHVEVWCFHIVLTQQCMLGDLVHSLLQPTRTLERWGWQKNLEWKRRFLLWIICPSVPPFPAELLSSIFFFRLLPPSVLHYLSLSNQFITYWHSVWTWALRTQKESSFTISCKDNQRL